MFERYRLHHVGVIFPSLEEAEAHMRQFGLQESYRGFVPQWHACCIFTQGAGETRLELVIPQEGPLTRFNKGMGGVHHYAYEIDDFAAAADWCKANDLSLLEPEPIKGAGDFWCNFIHPLGTRGIQIELVQVWR